MIIFDCNGVLVDSEPIVAAVLVQEFDRAGFGVSREILARYFTGRRPADLFAAVEAATGRKLPANFAETVAIATLRRFRTELKPTPHVEHALSWLRGPKCVASSSPRDRIRVALESAGLAKFFGPHLFSASDVVRGKPAPDLFLKAASRMQVQAADCVVVEDSAAGIQAAASAGMTPIGFVGGTHSGGELSAQLAASGARAVIADMRDLKATVSELRGW